MEPASKQGMNLKVTKGDQAFFFDGFKLLHTIIYSSAIGFRILVPLVLLDMFRQL